MAANYLHGVETIETETAGQLIRIVKSSVVALVGIAPTGPKDVLTLCLNDVDDAQFGSPLTGFNIPKTLELIRKEAGGCPVLVVNTFDAVANTTQVTDESQTVENGKLKLAFQPIGEITIKNNDDSPATIVDGTDYKIDVYGNFTVLSNAIANNTTYKFSYKKLNAGSVNAAQIVGTVNGNVRTGCKLFATAFNLFGYNPKILIAPQYSTLSGVANELRSMASSFRAVSLIDAPAATTVANAIAGRGVNGNIGFNIADERAILLYPQIKTYDKATDDNGNYPYSAFMAGVMVKNDQDNGYWYSPSNKQITSAVGSEINITAGLNDASSEANQLNEVGITTVFNSFGTGIRTWGNRNSSYPSSTSAKNFINIRRIADVVQESIELSALNYADRPINQALIDLIRQDGNNFIAALIQRGALLPGSKLTYNSADNPPAQLAAGQIVFCFIYMGPPPAERITFKSVLDINLLQSIK